MCASWPQLGTGVDQRLLMCQCAGQISVARGAVLFRGMINSCCATHFLTWILACGLVAFWAIVVLQGVVSLSCVMLSSFFLIISTRSMEASDGL